MKKRGIAVLVVLTMVFGMVLSVHAAKNNGIKNAKYKGVISILDAPCEASGVMVDENGDILVTDTENKVIWKKNAEGTIHLAGKVTEINKYGEPAGGFKDGGMGQALFKSPWDITPFMDGYAISDPENNAVRFLSYKIGVRTLAGKGEAGLKDGLGTRSRLDYPTGLTTDGSGRLYIADTNNGAIRMLDKEGNVTTYAKGLDTPTGICWKNGVLYVCETGLHRIVTVSKDKITPLVGLGVEGYADGFFGGAMFAMPQGIAVDDDGVIYVADTGNHAVRKVIGDQVTTLLKADPKELASSPVSPRGIALYGDKLIVCDNFLRATFMMDK